MKNLSISLQFLSFLLCISLFLGCEKDHDFGNNNLGPNPITPELDYALGYTGEDDLSTIPTSTNFGFSTGNLPGAVDLTSKFPPIGDQGQFGTCVAWAVGYNVKTAINGMSKGLSPSQLSSRSNQFSPKDLYTAIPDNMKRVDCGGTGFSPALDVLQSRGVATMSTVPYDINSDCSQSNLQNSWTTEANDNKIKYWRKIEPSVESIKQNLANNIPVILGAKLADNFMSWNSEAVLTSGSTTSQVGQHAYHAMVIAGYDNSKGQNGAFKVINSWGENWGDRGYIWVDYNYMINEFCVDYNGDQPLFIAADDNQINPQDNNPPPTTSGKDVAPWVFADYSDYQNTWNPVDRKIEFNIYNLGSETITPSPEWMFTYIYFNPYDINDYGIIFNDYLNNAFPPNTFDWFYDGFMFNFNIPPGSSLMEAVWGIPKNTRSYEMPLITGQYYLALIADSYDAISEKNEMNNIFYTTANPIYFQDGYGFSGDADGRSENSSSTPFAFSNESPVTTAQINKGQFNAIVNDNFKNAYTQEEVTAFFKQEYKNGNMQQKIEAARNLQKNKYKR